jgi:hypothetical protein
VCRQDLSRYQALPFDDTIHLELSYHRRVFFPHLDSARSPLPVFALHLQYNASLRKDYNSVGAAALRSETVQVVDAAYVDDVHVLP